MGSAFAAGAGADMLQQILRQKFAEAMQQQQLQEQQRQADMQQQVQQQRLGQDQSQFDASFGQRTREYDEAAPQRAAGLEHVTAQTADIKGRPQMAEAARAAQQAAAEQQRGFTAGQNDLNRQNAVRIAGINGQNAARTASIRMGDGKPPAAAQQQQQNEVQDALNLIQQIRDDKALPTATGPIDARGLGMMRDMEGVTRVQTLHDNLVNKMALAQSGKLKGQGPVSNFERDMLQKAATALTLKLGDPDYLTELAKVEEQFKRILTGGGAAPTSGGFTVEEIK
jgi:hypothetical protein